MGENSGFKLTDKQLFDRLGAFETEADLLLQRLDAIRERLVDLSSNLGAVKHAVGRPLAEEILRGADDGA